MRKAATYLVLAAVVSTPLLYLGHLYANYRKIQTELARKSATIVRPSVRNGDASDLGYIYSMRRETRIREGRLNLVWFVVVPATNVHYSCPYEEGYSGFRTGDSVRLVHTKKEEEGDYGYIVGLHANEQGKAALVWNFNLDAAEDNEPLDDE